MTKSKQIMSLYDGIRTPREIADIVGCRPEYVRVVARQRKGTGQSDIDRRYNATPQGKTARRRQARKWAPQHRAASRAWQRSMMRTGDLDTAKARGRQVYAAAKAQGKSRIEATRLAIQARRAVLSETCNRTAARLAYRKAWRASRLAEASC